MHRVRSESGVAVETRTMLTTVGERHVEPEGRSEGTGETAVEPSPACHRNQYLGDPISFFLIYFFTVSFPHVHGEENNNKLLIIDMK